MISEQYDDIVLKELTETRTIIILWPGKYFHLNMCIACEAKLS